MRLLTNPRTGLVRTPSQGLGEVDVATAIARARRAQPDWAALTAGERSRRLLGLAAAIEEHAQDYVLAEQSGTGKHPDEARAEVAHSADIFRFFAGALRADLAPAGGRHMPGRESWVRWEPFGVIAAIVPWNYPLLMAAWRVAPALAAGNAVVLKPAETTPDSALIVATDADATLGSGVLTTLVGDRTAGRRLAEGLVDMIAFTGSAVGGIDVAARAGLRRVSLELGGNCAAIVLPDAPSDTFEAIVKASTYNAGQSCAAPARVITLVNNYAETVDRLGQAMCDRRAGSDFGPLNNLDQVARYDKLVSASAANRQIVANMLITDAETNGYWRPGRVLADLPEDDPAVVEEVFGPVLTVQAADDLEDALRLANGVPQALAASIWSNSIGEVLGLAASLECGEVWVNCHLDQTAELPHGGRRSSGSGTDLSTLAMAEYQRPKTVTVRVS